MVKSTFFITLGLIISSTSLLAQDPIFSQPSSGNIQLNSALAGNDNQGRLSINYRNQWPGVIGNYVTSSINFYQYIPKLNGYGGVNFINDNVGNIIKTRQLSLFYSQNINIGNLLIRPSIQFGYGTKSLDWAKLTFGNNIDPRGGTVVQTGDLPSNPASYFDLNTGILISYKNLTIGTFVHHINRPNQSLILGNTSILPVRYGAQFSYLFNFNKFGIAPFGFYVYQNGFQSGVGGIRLSYKNKFNFALSYRTQDAYILNIGYSGKRLAINYSYDITNSKLTNNLTGGAHEIGICFKLWKVKPIKRLLEVKSVFN